MKKRITVTHASRLQVLWMDAIEEVEGFDRLRNRRGWP